MDASDMDIGRRILVLNKILKDNIIGSEFEKYLNEKERKKIFNLSAETSRLDMIDDNYTIMESEVDEDEEGTYYCREVINTSTLEVENPYSPTYSISKVFFSEDGFALYDVEMDEAVSGQYIYRMNKDHPDNLIKTSMLFVSFLFDIESGREEISKIEILRPGGITKSYPPEKAAEFAKYMTLGIEK